MDRESVVDLITSYLANILSLPAEKIDVNLPFERYGLDSTAAAGLSGEIGEELGLELSPNIAFDYPTVASMADHVASVMTVQAV